MRVSRRVATTTALGTAGAVGASVGFLFGETVLARRLIGVTDARPPSPDGLYGDNLPGETVRLLVLGDSAAVGYGMQTQMTTPPALLGWGLAQMVQGPVEVRSVAVVGAESSDLAEQVDRGLGFGADVAVIVIGANDVTHLKSMTHAVDELQVAISRLVAAGTDVVLGTCPDLGTVKPLMQPLRSIARLQSRRMARKQTVGAIEAGARTVSLGSLLAPMFSEYHELFFGDDRFHPSASGYASMVGALLPSLADAIHERRSEPLEARTGDAEEMMPVTEAAEEASQRSGTEVRRAGRWAGVLRRLR
ncbi:MAG: SGNH/GDSL hydrolase family protein [Aeromicrobium sp.]|uniref:SGNH/GDSL hydrolase family protein n=1 Tax=Aeromicrobium sp. TaxID=1871063 RepID=UPI0025B7ED7D|nr:SGNH/GDSL hydrolase family protein [Aeromicrobium sp.]MDF1703840.1 SGNH/GDSL hydrolase family protein [Aeromicrobium sp.]